LETAVRGGIGRQAAYALTLLADAPNYDIRPILTSLEASPLDEVRERAYEIAEHLRFEGLLDRAAARLRAGAASLHVVRYLVAVSPERERLAAELLQNDNPEIVEAALEGIGNDRATALKLIGLEWIEKMARSNDPRRRSLAATAISVRGDRGTDAIHYLFEDADYTVVRAALRAAGVLQSRAYLDETIRALDHVRLRGDAIQALTAFGSGITGSLSDILNDEKVSVRIRRQIPRVLKNLAAQRSVDVLLPAIGHSDLSIRAAALKALNHLRETAPKLNFNDNYVTNQLMNEARACYESTAALEPFRDLPTSGRPALKLLAQTMEHRLKDAEARLFRLLGLCYPPKDVYSAYLAVSKPAQYDMAAGLEFLDNVLDRNIKRVLLPLLDAPQNLLDRGQELFGIRKLTLEEAIGMQIRSGDPWLAACAMGAAAELRIRSLAADIALAGREGTAEISRVAQSAEATLI
jgi:AAA family ATP:ADP antiporter